MTLCSRLRCRGGPKYERNFSEKCPYLWERFDGCCRWWICKDKPMPKTRGEGKRREKQYHGKLVGERGREIKVTARRREVSERRAVVRWVKLAQNLGWYRGIVP